MRRSPRTNAWLLAPVALALTALSSLAWAHGPSVRVSYGGVKPAQLAIHAGQTVHFHNANASAGSCTIVATDGSFQSPRLERGEGWHHTFEKQGDHAFFIGEYPGAKGRVVVAAPRQAPAPSQ